MSSYSRARTWRSRSIDLYESQEGMVDRRFLVLEAHRPESLNFVVYAFYRSFVGLYNLTSFNSISIFDKNRSSNPIIQFNFVNHSFCFY